MAGEPSSTSRGHAAELVRIADALGARFRVGNVLPWGQTIPYFAAEADIGKIVIAALPLAVSREDGSSDAFHDAAFELVELTGRGLPTVFRHGVAGGVPYFAYRMPRGRTLAERLAEGPFTSRGVLRIAESLLEALSTLHRHGVVHGEITPKNVLIEERGEKMLVTLIGTGLSMITQKLRAFHDERTSGFAPSLSAYLAPELLAGETPTVASDLFALGTLLHHVVAGRAPTGVDSAEAYTDVPSLVDVVRRAREPEPERRYESAQAMRSAIDWVEVESERQFAQTQDIPLWMEMSVVANIPVTDLIKAKGSPTSQPPPASRKSDPSPSRYGSVPMPAGPRSGQTSLRASGSFSIPPAPKVPMIDEPTPVSSGRADDAIEIDLDLEPTPVSRIVPAEAPARRSPVLRLLALGVVLAACVAVFVLLFVD